MGTRMLAMFLTVLLLLTASPVEAQRRDKDKGDARDDAKGPPPGLVAPGAMGGMGAVPNVLMQVLDADGDGTISAKELRNAVRALKSLDTNHDGKLTPDELLPGGAPALPAMGGDKGGAPAGGGGPPAGAAAGGAPGAAAGPGVGGFGGFGAAGGGGLGGGAPVAGGAMNPGAGVRVPGGGLPAQVSKLLGFDKNRDGKVTKAEVPEELLPLFQRLDLDRDGAIDIRELRALRAD